MTAARKLNAIVVIAAGIYFGATGISFGQPVAVPDNIDSPLQKLALHAMQTMPEAQAVGVHGQIAKVSSSDKTQIPGRWDADDRVLVHIHLNGEAALADVAKAV